jgi:rRNA maturation endonuclease Nob1
LQGSASDIFVLDATAFYQGFHLRTSEKCITTELIINEVSHIRKNISLMSFLIEGQKISILEPKQESVDRVKTVARQIGDSKISAPDISVISLAIEYGGTIVSDDYRVCNLAHVLCVPTWNLASYGIKGIRKWTKFCKECRKQYSSNASSCSICGNSLSVRYRERKLSDGMN